MKSKKKAICSVTIDCVTGEVDKILSRGSASCSSCPVTGFEWFKRFSALEIRTMVYLNEIRDPKERVSRLTTSGRLSLCSFAVLSRSSFYRVLRSLEKKHGIIKLNMDELIVNPSFFFRGGTINLRREISQFYTLYNERYGTNISCLDDINE